MMNSYFEQSGFYGGHGQTGTEAHQAYRFPLGLGVNPYGPPSSGPVGRGQVDSYDAAAAAAAAASCKLYEQQYKLDCAKDVVQSGYGSGGIVKTDNSNSAISSWAAAAAAAAAAERVNGNVGGGGGRGGGYPVSGNVGLGGAETPVAVSAVTPRAPPSSVTINNNPWSPCSLNGSGVAVAPVPQQQQQVQQQQHSNIVQQQHSQVQQTQVQQTQAQQQQQQVVQQQQHHNSSGGGGQHGSLSQQQSPQSQSSAHTFYPWMAIAGKPAFYLFCFEKQRSAELNF